MNPKHSKTVSEEVIQIKNLTCIAKSSGIRVVDNVSFTIYKGDSIGLLGESGVGKTTLFRAILGLLPASDWQVQGDIFIKGKQLIGLTPNEMESVRGRQIRCIFQEPGLSLNPSIRIEKQFIEAIRVISPEVDDAKARETMSNAMREAGLANPEKFSPRYPGELSGGQRQRVGIGLSLCRPCALLLADEPSNSLDSVTITELVSTLRRLKNSAFVESLFCITHDLSVLSALETERVLFMHAGQMYEVGTIMDVFSNPGHEKLAEMVGLSDIVNRHGGAGLSEQAPDTAEARPHQQADTADSDPLVSIANLEFGFHAKSFFGKKKSPVLSNVTLDINRGEFVALVGTSGSGKSTIGGVLARLLTGFEGTITFEGMDITSLKRKRDRERFYKQLQVVFQDPADTFDPALSMRQNLEECFTAMGIERIEMVGIFSRLMELLLLEQRTLDEMPENLSGGQKQRYALLRAFGSDPSLIIADEPFTHLDLIAQSRLIQYLLDRKEDRQNPMSCLLISHEIGIVSKLCDRIVVIDDGKVVEDGLAKHMIKNASHPATNKLIQAASMLGTLSAQHPA